MRILPIVLLLLPASIAAQEPVPPQGTDTASASDTGRVSRSRDREPRRQPVTPELDRTAFADERARTLLTRARIARTTQDSALLSYSATAVHRLSVGLGIRNMFDRLLFRGESSARVSWSRTSGVWIRQTGGRAAAPMFGEDGASMDIQATTSIPYFPGREALWMPSSTMGVTQVEVNERELLHPLAIGSEAYYTYAVGDSMTFRLPDGRSISLRELRVTARRPDWRAFVGSFWFDTERGSLVRAAYRMSAEMDVWQVAGEDARREAERGLEEARKEGPPILARLMISPLRANLTAVTVEYGLHEGRFWLPKLQVAEGHGTASFARIPVKWEESFRYESVNADLDLPPHPTLQELGLAASDTTWGGHLVIGADLGTARTPEAQRARDDSLIVRYRTRADSLRRAAAAATASGDTAAARRLTRRAETSEGWVRRIIHRQESCARDSAYISSVSSRHGGMVRTVTLTPCDRSELANSPDLPHSLFDEGEAVFGAADRDQLLASLDLSLQPGWGPQPPVVRTGMDLLRYNRIEGLSVGIEASSALGRGYTANAEARIGIGDWVPNGGLSLQRSNGRTTVGLGVFHRLAVANDFWGSPLSFGASAANLAYARDEGFYYRTWGAELRARGEQPGPLGANVEWRLFLEQHRTAGTDPNLQFSLAGVAGNTRFERNIDATQLTALGASGEARRTFGANPFRYRLALRSAVEGAVTDRSDSLGNTMYGRLAGEATLSRLFGRLGASLTGAAGSSIGDLPIQRAFYIGGLHTVRGQFARPDPATGHVGEAFWLGRTELGVNFTAVRPVIFYDVGWSGRRGDFANPGRPMSGAGAGVSILDGLLRFDLARGIWPEQRWRADVQLGARF
jgi:hypothetical protein